MHVKRQNVSTSCLASSLRAFAHFLASLLFPIASISFSEHIVLSFEQPCFNFLQDLCVVILAGNLSEQSEEIKAELYQKTLKCNSKI